MLKNKWLLLCIALAVIAQQEDEEICDWIMDKLQLEPVQIFIHPEWGIVETFSPQHKAPGIAFTLINLKAKVFLLRVSSKQMK